MSLVSRIIDLAVRIGQEFQNLRNEIKEYSEGSGIDITNEVISIDINGLSQLLIPASGDFVALYDISTGSIKKVSLANVSDLSIFNASKLRGKMITTATPADGNAIIFNSSTNQWEYGSSVGQKGEDGEDGREVELRNTGTYIQWRYAGAVSWTNLIALSTLKGDPGQPGLDGNSAYIYIGYASDDSGADFTMTFDPNLDYIAILTTDTEILNPDSTDFEGLWKKYKGEDGGSGGISSFDEMKAGRPVDYGPIYNHYAVTDERNIANEGWRLPTRDEMEALGNYLGGSSVAGGKLKEVGLEYWETPNIGATNEAGFNARGAGGRAGLGGSFNLFKQLTRIWASGIRYGGAEFMRIMSDSAGLFYGNTNRWYGSTVRLVNDSTNLSNGETGTYIGNDGKSYPTICIGPLEWLAWNLNETKYRNGDWIHGFDGGVYTPISNSDWMALTTGAMCYYEDDESLVGGETKLSDFIRIISEEFLVKNEWQIFEYRDIQAGVADTFVLDILADTQYTIDSIVLKVDNGTLTGIDVKINGTAVSGLSSITASETATRINATAANSVSPGDTITLDISAEYTGTPTKLIGKLSYMCG